MGKDLLLISRRKKNDSLCALQYTEASLPQMRQLLKEKINIRVSYCDNIGYIVLFVELKGGVASGKDSMGMNQRNLLEKVFLRYILKNLFLLGEKEKTVQVCKAWGKEYAHFR